jgi:hypothetical protein
MFGLKESLVIPSVVLRVPTVSSQAFSSGVHRSMSAFAGADVPSGMLVPMGAAGWIAVPAAALAPAAAERVEHDTTFVKYLFQRGRVEFGSDVKGVSAAGPVPARKTHRVVRAPAGLVLERIGFDCGFD